MSYERKKSEVESYLPYDRLVDAFNSATPEGKPLYISCTTPILDECATRTYFDLIASLSAQLTLTTDERKAAPILLRRAVAYTVVQNFQDAIEDLTSYLAVDSISPLPYWQRAACRMKQISIMMLSDGNKSEAVDMKLVTVIDDLDKAISLNPDCAFIYYNRGNAHSHRGDFDKAIADYDKAITLDPNLAEAYYNRGLAQIRKKETDKAIADLSKAGELGLYKAYGIIKKYTKK